MNLYNIIKDADKALVEYYEYIDETAFYNQKKVLDAFRMHRISETHFNPSFGYGYGDRGREAADAVYAAVFDAEAALARHNVISGTHALTIALFALLRPDDTLFSVSGKPYDTLDGVIGINGAGKGEGTLADFGIKYTQAELTGDINSPFDLAAIKEKLTGDSSVKVVFVQKSRGYSLRNTLKSEQIGELVKFVKKIRSDIYLVVDNCYGEFVEKAEPTSYGADLIVGSLIKNPGGGVCDSGAYFAGTKAAVELVSYRQTCPGIGAESGATLGQNRNILKGLFLAPSVVASAVKTAIFGSYVFEREGFSALPKYTEKRADIIQTFEMGNVEKLCAFCRGIQKYSPIDSHVIPEPWDMPGYKNKVIMAAGAFTQGASIEMSADAPLREPFVVYMQGALTFESGKLAVLSALEEVVCIQAPSKLPSAPM